MRLAELRYKEIINVNDGHRLGFVSDLEFDAASGRVTALIVPGPCRFFGLFGREDDYVLPYDCISRVGDDIILVESGDYKRSRRDRKQTY